MAFSYGCNCLWGFSNKLSQQGMQYACLLLLLLCCFTYECIFLWLQLSVFFYGFFLWLQLSVFCSIAPRACICEKSFVTASVPNYKSVLHFWFIPFCCVSKHIIISRCIAKWIYQKLKATYNLEWKEYSATSYKHILSIHYKLSRKLAY